MSGRSKEGASAVASHKALVFGQPPAQAPTGRGLAYARMTGDGNGTTLRRSTRRWELPEVLERAKEVLVHASRAVRLLDVGPHLIGVDYVAVHCTDQAAVARLEQSLPRPHMPVHRAKSGTVYRISESEATPLGTELLKIYCQAEHNGFLGYVDFVVDNFSGFGRILREGGLPARLIEGDGWEMFELVVRHEQVLLYFPSRPLSADLAS